MTRRRLAALLAAAALLGNLAPIRIWAAPTSITLQPGESITIVAATPAPTAAPTNIPSLIPSPSPTPAPTAGPTSPTPSQSPSVSPPPTATPSPGDPFAVPFGSRPSSGPISLSGSACQNITISNKTFRALGAGVRAIRLENCNGVTIEQVDFIDVAMGVYAVNSSNITLRDSRYQNIIGPAHDAAGKRTTNLANLIQLNNVSTALVDHNKGRCGDTEDIVSIYSSRDVVASRNQFEGGDGSPGCLAWVSNSGSGIAVESGARNVVRDNILVNPGQVGAFINSAGSGNNSQINGSVIIGEQRPFSNRPSYVGGSAGCGVSLANNRARWIDKSGALLGFYDVGGDGCTQVQTNNNWTDTTLDINAYRVRL